MKPDMKALQGTWDIVSLEMDGEKYPAVGSQIAVKGGRFTSLNMGAEYSGTMAVDESASPKTFDLIFDSGPEKGNRSLGIYELDGDTWKICLGLTGKTRPTKFVSAPGSGHALEILRRGRGGAKKKLPAADEHAEPVAELEGGWFMVSCRQDGQPMDSRFVKAAKREFRGNTTTLTGGRPGGNEEPVHGRLRPQDHRVSGSAAARHLQGVRRQAANLPGGRGRDAAHRFHGEPRGRQAGVGMEPEEAKLTSCDFS